MTATGRSRVLWLTDLNYRAVGRRYCDEDIMLTDRLSSHFHIALCHPRDAVAFMDDVDVVLVRNTGPVTTHLDAYRSYRDRAAELGVPVFTEAIGKGDQAGKQYLVDLTSAGSPVIPTVDTPEDLDALPDVALYVVKPKDGADSAGLRVATRAEVETVSSAGDTLIQPRIDFTYEVSFYFVDRTFQYALYAPDTAHRWELEPYDPTPADIEFSQHFVDWNAIDHGIQRVDACRTSDGRLLLVELEDLNPYLSLDRVAETDRSRFIDAMVASLRSLVHGHRPITK